MEKVINIMEIILLLYSSVFLSIYLSRYLYIHPSVYLFISISIHLSIYLSFYSIYLSIYKSIYLSPGCPPTRESTKWWRGRRGELWRTLYFSNYSAREHRGPPASAVSKLSICWENPRTLEVCRWKVSKSSSIFRVFHIILCY